MYGGLLVREQYKICRLGRDLSPNNGQAARNDCRFAYKIFLSCQIKANQTKLICMTYSFVSMAGLDLCALLLPSVFAGANYQGSMLCRFQAANTRGSRKSKRVREQLQSALFTLN